MNYREETTMTNEELKKIREEKNQSKGEYAAAFSGPPWNDPWKPENAKYMCGRSWSLNSPTAWSM